MDNEMIERVAKSIGDALYGYCDKKDTPNTWSSAMGAAIEAIKAMREPTEKQLNAVRDWSIKKYGRGVGNDGAIGCYNVMIDCIIND